MKHFCQECHEKRRKRQEPEAQPLQWTGDTSEYIKGCDDCGRRSPGTKYYYANAFELLQDLEEAKDTLKNLEVLPDFPLPYYHSAGDMLNAWKLMPGNTTLEYSDVENLLEYTEELEEVLSNCS